ncbi:uncharacterized protein [Haliotis asinina]|uniref:uncharacterized protein n=1 Tax=Haliotis asinina TaxID=109174 RepID=UPI00353268BB
METVHREILRKNYSGLVQAIQRVGKVVDKLVQFNVLTCLMKADIIEKPQTSFNRARELLNMSPRRGPQAYTLFCKALEECGEIQALTLLGLETDQEMTELPDPRCHLHLGDNVYMTAKTWDDVLSIHVRKYEVYPSGMAYPTKRGIVLSLKHWMELPGAIRSIEEAVKEGKPNSQWHLGANVFVTMDSTRSQLLGRCVKEFPMDTLSGEEINMTRKAFTLLPLCGKGRLAFIDLDGDIVSANNMAFSKVPLVMTP